MEELKKPGCRLERLSNDSGDEPFGLGSEQCGIARFYGLNHLAVRTVYAGHRMDFNGASAMQESTPQFGFIGRKITGETVYDRGEFSGAVGIRSPETRATHAAGEFQGIQILLRGASGIVDFYQVGTGEQFVVELVGFEGVRKNDQPLLRVNVSDNLVSVSGDNLVFQKKANDVALLALIFGGGYDKLRIAMCQRLQVAGALLRVVVGDDEHVDIHLANARENSTGGKP